jgi:hypothetical protein
VPGFLDVIPFQSLDVAIFVVLQPNMPYRMLSTVWPEPIWIKVNSSRLLLPQHQSTYLRGPESIEIPPQFIKLSEAVFYFNKKQLLTTLIIRTYQPLLIKQYFAKPFLTFPDCMMIELVIIFINQETLKLEWK